MRTITIVSVVDVAAALADDTLSGSIYLVDNNEAGGSTGEGTEALSTRVKRGDIVVWISTSLESEAHVAIASVVVDERYRRYCNPRRFVYAGTNVDCWVGVITQDVDTPIPYALTFTLGTRTAGMTTTAQPMLVGAGTGTTAAA